MFVALGLGVLAVYAIGWRPRAIWPLIPGTVLVVLGVMALGAVQFWPLASFAWIAAYWPVVLVVVGLWLLVSNRVPTNVRRAIETIGLVLLILYGLFSLGAIMAAIPFAGATP